MAGLVEVHLDRSGTGMGTGLFCRDGVASTFIDAVWGSIDDHGGADESRASDRHLRWDPQQWIWAFLGQAFVDRGVVYRVDGDATESDVGLGRFQQALD